MLKLSVKQISFYAILIALPFVLLLLIEAILRLAQFGQETPLFIPVDQQGATSHYLQPNPNVIHRYFANEKLAPNVSPDTVYFDKDKSEDSFRIFIQGGSTAAGFPYGRWASLQGMLEQRFKRLYPNKKIEIINTAMAAVNSYTLLDFVDEIIAEQPDLILLYAGHNEYLGVMGVGSAFAAKGGRFTTLMHLKFKNWRIYQLMQSLYFSLLSAQSSTLNTDRTLMSQVVKEKEIVFGSDLYEQGIVQFRENMSLILNKYKAANISVVLGSLVSNESGQIPFSSVGNVDWEAYKKILASQTTAQTNAHIVQLQNQLLGFNDANHYYQLGLSLQSVSRFVEAKEAFVNAKEFDLLRFRAPEKFTEITQELSNNNNVYFADVNTKFKTHTENGIIDNSLILEHLHPTVEGYFLLAESFVEVINNEKLMGVLPQNYSLAKARADIPLSNVDKMYGDFVVAKLMNDYPFVSAGSKHADVPLPEGSVFEKEALIKRINNDSWLALQRELLVKYQQNNDIAEAAKIAGLIATAMVDNHKAAYIAGQLYQQLNDWQLARYYHKKALNNLTLSAQTKVQYLLLLAQDNFMLEHYQKSISLLKTADELVPDDAPIKSKIAQYLQNAQQALMKELKNNHE